MANFNANMAAGILFAMFIHSGDNKFAEMINCIRILTLYTRGDTLN